MKGERINRHQAGRWNDAGTAIIEFGLVVTVFFMFVFGVMDFGRMIYTYHFVSDAACQATRYAIVRGAASTDPATAVDVADYVKSMIPEGIDPSDITVSTSWSPNNAPGSSVKVQVSDNFHFMTPVLAKYHMDLSDASQMVISQ